MICGKSNQGFYPPVNSDFKKLMGFVSVWGRSK